MRFTTEEFLHAVVRDIEQRHRLDPRSVFTLSWSSSGPAAYAASLAPGTVVRGSFIAMSVFRPGQLPPLDRARGQAYYLLHSPQDWIPLRMAEEARDGLRAAGASVELATYQGGHGWHGDVYGNLRAGLRWLESRAAGD